MSFDTIFSQEEKGITLYRTSVLLSILLLASFYNALHLI
jgi:hypothetical protein